MVGRAGGRQAIRTFLAFGRSFGAVGSASAQKFGPPEATLPPANCPANIETGMTLPYHPRMRDLQAAVQAFNQERGWTERHDPRSLALALCEEVGEVAKLLAWNDDVDHEQLGLELADVLIYAFSLSNRFEIDLEEYVRKKLVVNAGRFPSPQRP